MTSKERHELRYIRRKQKRLDRKMERLKDYDDYDKVFTYEHLYKAYRACRKNVRWKASIQRYIANAPLNILSTHQKLMNGTFKSDGFYEFDIFERGKARHIRSVTISERVVQRCLCDYSLVPMLTRTFIYDNGASMKNKGYTFAVNRMYTHLRKYYRHCGNDGYILLYDFSSYFDNIPHDLIYRILENEYVDNRLKKIIRHFVDMFGDIGIGLGSQISQVLALAAANGLDHYIKEKLKVKYYDRYMDDGYLIHHDKEQLKNYLSLIKEYCDNIGFILNLKKTCIVSLKHEFKWLKIKIRLTDTGYIVRGVWHKSIVRIRRRMKKLSRKLHEHIIEPFDLWQSFQSWESHVFKLNSFNTRKSMYQLYIKLCKDNQISPYVNRRNYILLQKGGEAI